MARASAFQAEGRGFESRFPLHFICVILDALRYPGNDKSGGQNGMIERIVTVTNRPT